MWGPGLAGLETPRPAPRQCPLFSLPAMGWSWWAGDPPARPLPVPPLLPASHGVELVNASALFLLLLLNLVLIGRQDRLKRREVERRLRGIIDQIQGEAKGQASQVGKGALGCVRALELPSPARSPSTLALPAVSIQGIRMPCFLLSGAAREPWEGYGYPGSGLGRAERLMAPQSQGPNRLNL